MTAPDTSMAMELDAPRIQPKLVYLGPHSFGLKSTKIWIISDQHAEGGLPLHECTLTSVQDPEGNALTMKGNITHCSSIRMPFSPETLQQRQAQLKRDRDVQVPSDVALPLKGTLFEFNITFSMSGLSDLTVLLEADSRGETHTTKELCLVFSLTSIQEEAGLTGGSLRYGDACQLRVGLTVKGWDVKARLAAREDRNAYSRAHYTAQRDIRRQNASATEESEPAQVPEPVVAESSTSANATGPKRKRSAIADDDAEEARSVAKAAAAAAAATRQRRQQELMARNQARKKEQTRMVNLAANDPAALRRALPEDVERARALAAEEETLLRSPVTESRPDNEQ